MKAKLTHFVLPLEIKILSCNSPNFTVFVELDRDEGAKLVGVLSSMLRLVLVEGLFVLILRIYKIFNINKRHVMHNLIISQHQIMSLSTEVSPKRKHLRV